ncbi:MAG: MotA/TolQ/ExbB proton channel family protein [Elusimicrobia bacterium]|nr:MotA/TolQ/ExbB proton channel family protein [Elusimicrobiota bacterium]
MSRNLREGPVGEIDLIQTFFGSFTLWILLGCSLISLTVALERWLYYRKIKFNPEKFMGILEKMQSALQKGNEEEALSSVGSQPGPIPDLVRTAVVNRHRAKVELDELLTAARMEQRLALEKYLGILGTLGNTAPFIGLFGTVVGIIKAFHDLAVSGSGGPAVVAAGISEALVATAAGLLVAIPSVVVYNYFMKRVKEMATILEVSSIRLLVVLHSANGK